MKKTFKLTFFALFFTLSSGIAQVNNFSDFLRLSELSEYGLTNYLQANWQLNQPVENIENGTAKSTYTFIYSYGNEKQILRRVISMDLETAYKIRSTIFISNDLELLERLKKGLPAYEYTRVGVEDDKVLFENGNKMVFIEEDFHMKAKGLYKLTLMFKDDFLIYKSKKEAVTKSLESNTSNNILYNLKWNLKGKGDYENDNGVFEITSYKNGSCEIILSIHGKIYRSFECGETEAKLEDKNGDIISIEYIMPEMADVSINILGNKRDYDYFSTY